MSLVNQMLKDLENRRAPEMGGEAVLRDLSVAPAQTPLPRRSWSGLLGVLAAVLAATGGVYWYQTGPTPPRPVAAIQAPAATDRHAPQTAAPATESLATALDAVSPETPFDAPLSKPEREPIQGPTPTVAPAPPPPAAAPPQVQAVHGEASVTAPAPVAEATAPLAGTTTPVAKATAAVASAPAPAAAPKERPAVERIARPQSPGKKAQALYLEGADRLRRGHLGDAESSLRAALALVPDLTEAREVLAALLIRAQRNDEAAATLQAGLDRNPGAYSLARIYARLLVERGEQHGAIAVLESALPAPVLDPEYYGLLAALYQRTGQHGRAAEAYRRVLAVSPDRGPWWVGLGISLERTRRLPEAAQAYRRARGTAGMNSQLLGFVNERLTALGAE